MASMMGIRIHGDALPGRPLQQSGTEMNKSISKIVQGLMELGLEPSELATAGLDGFMVETSNGGRLSLAAQAGDHGVTEVSIHSACAAGPGVEINWAVKL